MFSQAFVCPSPGGGREVLQHQMPLDNTSPPRHGHGTSSQHPPPPPDMDMGPHHNTPSPLDMDMGPGHNTPPPPPLDMDMGPGHNTLLPPGHGHGTWSQHPPPGHGQGTWSQHPPHPQTWTWDLVTTHPLPPDMDMGPGCYIRILSLFRMFNKCLKLW